jgi:hypothetical protein
VPNGSTVFQLGFAQGVIADAAEDIRNVLVPGVGVRLVRKLHYFFVPAMNPSICLFQSLHCSRSFFVAHHIHASMINPTHLNHLFRRILC